MFYSVKNFKVFRNKTVIITGHTGFKGAWLSFWLKTLGAKIIGISLNIPTKPSLFEIIIGNKYIKSYRCDIKNFFKVKKIILKHKPDFVFHLAAQALVKKSYINPLLTWNSNLLGTVNILESLRHLKKNCIAVIITSDKSYKNLEIKKGYKEEDQLGGHDPYSASKGAAEFAISSYINSYFQKKSKVKIGIARAGNVIGGGDWSEDRLLPDCIKSWSKGKKVNIRNPYSTRPWQHVLEAVSGYILLAVKLKLDTKIHGEAFNFGPRLSHNYSVLSLLNRIKKIWPAVLWSTTNNRKKFKESNLLKLNCNKAKKFMNWESILSFDENINMTIDWYRAYYKNKDSKKMKIFSQNQIIQFTNFITKRSKK